MERYYIITQEAAGAGNECPDFVRDNVTQVIECCGELCHLCAYQSPLNITGPQQQYCF